MKLCIEIETGNDAFCGDGQSPVGEIKNILNNLADRIDDDVLHGARIRLRDTNGNTVGYAEGVEVN